VRIAFKFRKTSFKAAPNGKRASKRDRLLTIAQQKLIRIIDSAELIDAAKLLRDRDTEIVAVCTPASPAMTRDVIVRKAGQLLGDVWSIMKKRKLKNIPVVDAESRPIGMLNARDTLQLLLKEAQDEELLLRDYVMCVGYH
jgi:CBS domain-containing protein